MNTPTLRSILPGLALALTLCAPLATRTLLPQDRPAPSAQPFGKQAMQVQYLEIVTPDLDSTCSALEKLHGVTFSEPVAELGNARTAPLKGGGRIGVRAPMRADEQPVVRPYLLVDDIAAAVARAQAAGAEIALPPMDLPGQGTCAIYLQGGNQLGLWK